MCGMHAWRSSKADRDVDQLVRCSAVVRGFSLGLFRGTMAPPKCKGPCGGTTLTELESRGLRLAWRESEGSKWSWCWHESGAQCVLTGTVAWLAGAVPAGAVPRSG